MKLIGTFNEKGISFGEHNAAKLRQYAKEHQGQKFTLEAIKPESRKQRGFLEGGLIPLIAYYQEGMNHEDSEDCRKVRDWLKLEFNGELVPINGKVQKVAKSTKGELNRFTERVVEWVEENYAPPREALDTSKYKIWKATVWPYGGPETWIGYLQSINILK